ncbi:hypothetical protein LEN26_020049 [Aphanomyces euteiches]|nr:hypothetical protein LEN26_020049 [Aphanomyces euteiches]KAH9196784.1 hypothetical protein AeNC1_001258 [Aphanomyces euteiches]
MMSKLSSIVQELRDGKIKHVVVFIGAGVSTASGIPDFRSPSGLYAQLRPELLTATPEEQALLRQYPTAVVTSDLFEQNAFPLLEACRPFLLGATEQAWKPTIAHAFFQLLHEKGLLQRIYSQNVDGLHYQLGIPRDRVVDVHGTMAQVQCERCQTDGGYTFESFCGAVRAKIKNIHDKTGGPATSSPILCQTCGRASVKPAVVLFGGRLPPEFAIKSATDLPACDLLIVAGTSLTVYPAAGLVTQVRPGVPRLVVNLEPVGDDLGVDCRVDSNRDAFVQADCDAGFLRLATELGWLEQLRALRSQLCAASQALLSP